MAAHCTIVPFPGFFAPAKEECVESVVVAQQEKANEKAQSTVRVVLPEIIRCTPTHCACDDKLFNASGRMCSWQHDKSSFSNQEPHTLSRQLFFYGFVFFPFWLVGASFLLARPNVQHVIDLTPAEREYVSKTEREWSWRCLEAFVGLVLMIAFFLAFYVSISN